MEIALDQSNNSFRIQMKPTSLLWQTRRQPAAVEVLLPQRMPVYRLTRPLAGQVVGQKRTIILSAGSLIERDEFLAPEGLVEIQCAGERLTVFVQDLCERSEPLTEAG